MSIANFLIRKKVSLNELQSLIGLLNFTCSVILQSRPFLCRLIDRTINTRKPYHKIRLTKAAKADLKTWQIIFLRTKVAVLTVPPAIHWLSRLTRLRDSTSIPEALILRDLAGANAHLEYCVAIVLSHCRSRVSLVYPHSKQVYFVCLFFQILKLLCTSLIITLPVTQK